MDVHETALVPAPPEQVWRWVTERDGRAEWWPYLDLDPMPGGRMEERWTDAAGNEVRTAGEVLEVDPPRLLRLSWKDDGWPAATEVEVHLEPQDRATLVTVHHSGWAALPDAETLVREHGAGWRAHLDDLRRIASEA